MCLDQPQFVIATSLNDYDTGDLLQFRAGLTQRDYLKSEEIGRAVVSDPFDFFPSPVPYSHWKDSETRIKFLECFRSIVQRNTVTTNRGGNALPLEDEHGPEIDHRERREMRLALCRLSGAPIFPSETDVQKILIPDFDDLIKVPMKLKLIPNYFLSDYKADNERSLITRLANCFGSQNLTLILEEDGDNGEHDIMFPSSVELVWNQEDLVWEAETQVGFIEGSGSDGSLEKFGGIGCRVESFFPNILVKLREAATIAVLNQQFGFYGDNQHVLRTLEGEINTDLVIKDKDGNSVKCHRFPLMCASAKLGNKLNDTGTPTPVINLDLNKEAIVAMLHFIYYGGSDRIVSGSATQALELLQVGHMYEIRNLVEVTSFVLLFKAGERFTFDEAWKLYRYSGKMINREENSRRKELEEKGSYVVRHYQDWDKNCVQIKASELYQKLLPIAEGLGPAFVAVLNRTPCTNDGAKALPINLNNVSMENCELLMDYFFAALEYHRISEQNLDEALGLLVLAGHAHYSRPSKFGWFPGSLFDKLLMKPIVWFEIDYLVTLFTMACEFETKHSVWNTMKIGTARKLKWFVDNHQDQVLESTKYQEMFKNNWKFAMEFTTLCIKESQV